MAFKFCYTAAYNRTKNKFIKENPLAKRDVENCETAVLKDPKKGDSCTYYSNFEIRKFKHKMKSYGLGKQSGIRFIYLNIESQIIPILIFKKGNFKQEKNVIDKVRTILNEIIKELGIE